MKQASLSQQNCPCDSGLPYHCCCEPYHLNQTLPQTAEQLMRSRYSAYVLQLTAYIKETWHSSTCPTLENLAEPSVKWLSLTINNTWNSEQASEAFVDFTARYKVNGKATKMHEISRFVFENKKWFYIDGKLF